MKINVSYFKKFQFGGMIIRIRNNVKPMLLKMYIKRNNGYTQKYENYVLKYNK